jgi:hypothetical protein
VEEMFSTGKTLAAPGVWFSFAVLPMWAVLIAVVLGVCPAHATTYTVNTDGTANFTTIQACANAAIAGDTCLVYPGVYTEHVQTAAGGTGESFRITFKAQGVVTMQGFDIRHPYVTVDGFDITGYTVQYQAHIRIFNGGDNCEVLNNIVRDGATNVSGIFFPVTNGQTASNCIVRGNKLSKLDYAFLNVNGDNHLFENNVLEYQNSMDYIRLFGSGHTFRRNVFWRGSTQVSSGNHPDFVQTFGLSSTKSENHLFENNWISDLPSQFCQVNAFVGVV